MHVFTATFGTETNSFSPIPTGAAAFAATMMWRPGEHPDFVTEATGPLWAARRRALEAGWRVTEGTCAFAMPGRPVTRTIYEELRDEILGQLAAAMPVDIVALGLHGAMMADGYLDCEADLLGRVRALVGPEVAMGAILDLHAHLSPAMLTPADVLIAFKEYPHTDFLDRAEELLDLLAATCSGQIRPVMALAAPPVLVPFATADGPGREMVDKLLAAEAGGLLSASWVHGFPKGDSPDLGSRILTISNGDRPYAQREADRLGAALLALREQPVNDPAPLVEQITRALAGPRPLTLVDAMDHAGGGGGNDNVEAIHALIATGARNVACGPIWDPGAVGFCRAAGVGAPIKLRIGGKSGPEAGRPLDVEGVVLGIAKNAYQQLGTARVPVGDAAAIETGGITILMTTLREQAYDPGWVAAAGVELATRDILMLKSAAQYRIGFGDRLENEVFLRHGPQMLDRRYRHRPRPLWPFEEIAV